MRSACSVVEGAGLATALGGGRGAVGVLVALDTLVLAADGGGRGLAVGVREALDAVAFVDSTARGGGAALRVVRAGGTLAALERLGIASRGGRGAVRVREALDAAASNGAAPRPRRGAVGVDYARDALAGRGATEGGRRGAVGVGSAAQTGAARGVAEGRTSAAVAARRGARRVTGAIARPARGLGRAAVRVRAARAARSLNAERFVRVAVGVDQAVHAAELAVALFAAARGRRREARCARAARAVDARVRASARDDEAERGEGERAERTEEPKGFVHRWSSTALTLSGCRVPAFWEERVGGRLRNAE